MQSNTANYPLIKIANKAVSFDKNPVKFYEFDNLHSEYNSLEVSQFEKEAWFQAAQPICTEVAATSIDDFCVEKSISPDMIKIDVEGFEYEVLKGGIQTLSHHKPIIIMEYLEAKRKNEPHKKAHTFLNQLGYKAHTIDANGFIQKVEDIETYLNVNKLESDNIVFISN